MTNYQVYPVLHDSNNFEIFSNILQHGLDRLSSLKVLQQKQMDKVEQLERTLKQQIRIEKQRIQKEIVLIEILVNKRFNQPSQIMCFNKFYLSFNKGHFTIQVIRQCLHGPQEQHYYAQSRQNLMTLLNYIQGFFKIWVCINACNKSKRQSRIICLRKYMLQGYYSYISDTIILITIEMAVRVLQRIIQKWYRDGQYEVGQTQGEYCTKIFDFYVYKKCSQSADEAPPNIKLAAAQEYQKLKEFQHSFEFVQAKFSLNIKKLQISQKTDSEYEQNQSIRQSSNCSPNHFNRNPHQHTLSIRNDNAKHTNIYSHIQAPQSVRSHRTKISKTLNLKIRERPIQNYFIHATQLLDLEFNNQDQTYYLSKQVASKKNLQSTQTIYNQLMNNMQQRNQQIKQSIQNYTQSCPKVQPPSQIMPNFIPKQTRPRIISIEKARSPKFFQFKNCYGT